LVAFNTENKVEVALWAQYAEAQLREAAQLGHTPQWAVWSSAMAPSVKFYARNLRMSGHSDMLDRKMGLGWKFYDNPFDTLGPTNSQTSQYGFSRLLMAPMGMEMAGMECELDELAREIHRVMKSVCRIMGQRKKRGLKPWPDRQATQYRRPYDGGLPG
jgi:hypothetical protein